MAAIGTDAPLAAQRRFIDVREYGAIGRAFGSATPLRNDTDKFMAAHKAGNGLPLLAPVDREYGVSQAVLSEAGVTFVQSALLHDLDMDAYPGRLATGTPFARDE